MLASVINPFIKGTIDVMNITTGLSLSTGKAYAKELSFDENTLRIILGITGEMQGQVIIAIANDKAKRVASAMMMGMSVNELDEMSLSALSELGNMAMGNSATNLSNNGVIIDITPPIIERGVSLLNTHIKNICIPLMYEGGQFMELNIAAEEK